MRAKFFWVGTRLSQPTIQGATSDGFREQMQRGALQDVILSEAKDLAN